MSYHTEDGILVKIKHIQALLQYSSDVQRAAEKAATMKDVYVVL